MSGYEHTLLARIFEVCQEQHYEFGYLPPSRNGARRTHRISWWPTVTDRFPEPQVVMRDTFEEALVEAGVRLGIDFPVKPHNETRDQAAA